MLTINENKEPTICVALGAPVPLEMLGARLETYISKAAMDTIQLCLRKLPVELICNIVEEIQSDYKEYLEWWEAANKCCQNNCSCYDGSEEHHREHTREHNKRLWQLMAKIGQRGFVTPFHKCRQV